MNEQSEFSLTELVGCAVREIALRRSVYPHMIKKGKMTEHGAAREIALMQAIRQNLEAQQQVNLL